MGVTPLERPSRLVVGLVRGLHGLRGALRVEILTDDPSRFLPGSVLHAEGTDDPLTVVWSYEDGPGVLVRFRETPSRAEAERLRDRYLEAPIAGGRLDADSFYWHELLGVPVLTADGERLGTVQDVFRAGEAEVLVVAGGSRGEVLVPAVRSAVIDFAPRDGRIVVDREALALDEPTPERRPRGRRTTRALRAAQPPESSA